MAELIKKNNEYVVRHVTLPATAQLSLEYGEVIEVNVTLVDKRIITEKQRKFIFALCNEMSYYTGDDSEWCRMQLQTAYASMKGIKVESLSNCSMTYANDLIRSIIDYFIAYEIPFDGELIKKNEYSFTEKQVYMMVLKRICVVCGKRADLHHFNCRVGIGRDRKKISHIGMEIMPLCRIHHQEAHTIGDKQFSEKYHVENGIIVDDKMNHFIKKGIIKVYENDRAEKERE